MVPADTQATTVAPRGRAVAISRVYHTVVAAVGAATLTLSLFLSATSAGNGGALNGIWFTLSYFTVLSNILTLAVNAWLAANPIADGNWFRWLRMTSLVMIVITGLVYAIVLAPISNPVGLDVYTNLGYHYFVPWATFLGFLLFGPRPRMTVDLVPKMLVIPIIWLVYTMLRGLLLLSPPAIAPETELGPPQHWYPYPFLDVNDPSPLVPGVSLGGYAGVGVNLVLMVLLVVVFGFIMLGLDRLLSRGARPSALSQAERAPAGA